MMGAYEVRSRMREATDEGRVAAHEAEAASRARYAELVHGAEGANAVPRDADGDHP